jgi:hypothetical protein
MTSFGVFCVFILIALAAIMADHYSRLKGFGWMPEGPEWMRGRSALDPVGGALGELGRAELPFKMVSAPVDALGKVTELVWAPIGAGLSMVAKGTELVFKGIGAALGAVTGFGLKNS